MEYPRDLNKLLASDAQTLIRINHGKQASARRLPPLLPTSSEFPVPIVPTGYSSFLVFKGPGIFKYKRIYCIEKIYEYICNT